MTLLHSDAFWRRLAARTGRDSSPADREAVADAFAADLTRLLLDRGGSDGRRLAVDLGLERRAADAVARFVSETTVPGWPAGVACGPLMLARAPEQATVIGAAAAGAPGPAAERVRLMLSPLGRGCHLLEEDLLDEAVAELEPLSTMSPVARERYHEALVRLAVEQAEERRWGPAVTSFIRAARDGADVQEHANLLREAVSGRMRELAAEDGDDGSAVVEMIEVLGPFVPRDATFDADAAASYAKLGRHVNNAHDYEAAVELLDKALDLMPDDRTIRRFACVATRNLADDLLDIGTWASVRRAFALLDRSRGYGDGDAASAAGMSRLLLGKAHKLVEREHLDVAEAVVREALRHDDVPLGWCILATVHVKRGRRGDACAALLDGRRRHPHDTELRETHDRLCSRAPTARGGTT